MAGEQQGGIVRAVCENINNRSKCPGVSGGVIQLNETKLECSNCEATIPLPGSYEISSVSCESCKKDFMIIPAQQHAVASSGKTIFHKWSSDRKTILRCYFNNHTLETLEGAAESLMKLHSSEIRPYELVPVAKAHFDVVKKRLQMFLSRPERANLDAETREEIANDGPDRGKTLEDLLGLLESAFPGNSKEIRSISRRSVWGILRWLRNKEEHLAPHKWTVPSYLHTCRNAMPGDPKESLGKFDFRFLIKVNNSVIDLLQLLYDIDRREYETWQYDAWEICRVTEDE